MPMTTKCAMPEGEQVASGRSGAYFVVRLDRAMLGQRAAVDEDHRQARPPDLFDFGMILAQAHGHESVDRRTPDGSDERSVERRDEEEAISRRVGGSGHASAQLGVERVAEHDAQHLWRKQPDSHRVLLSEHPANGMRPVAHRVSDPADHRGRGRVQALRAVERKGDGGLRHTRFLRHVGDPRAPRPGIHALLHGPRPTWGRRCLPASG